jgi:hypothetical protein
MTDNQKVIFQMLFEKFGTMLLTKEQMCKVCNISERTLDRHRSDGFGCEYKVSGGRVHYPLDKVVEHLSKVNKTH